MQASPYKRCPNCQTLAPAQAVQCARCGLSYSGMTIPNAPPPWQQPEPVRPRGPNVASLVAFALGAGSLLVFPLYLGAAAFVMGIIGSNLENANGKSKLFAFFGWGIGLFSICYGLYTMGLLSVNLPKQPEPTPPSPYQWTQPGSR